MLRRSRRLKSTMRCTVSIAIPMMIVNQSAIRVHTVWSQMPWRFRPLLRRWQSPSNALKRTCLSLLQT